MALTLPCESLRIVSIEEYIDYIRTNVNLRDLDSVAASAPMLRALANDRHLVLNRLNQEVEKSFLDDNRFLGTYFPSVQVILLARGENFYVRAAVWPSTVNIAADRIYHEQFTYDQAHDHNFTFMTVNYLGPGYETDIYEYDYEKVEGYIGEPVDIRFLQKVRFASNSAMLYRASKDLHIQYPPPELTITLNLVILLPETLVREQFHFDVEHNTISGYPSNADAAKQVSLITMAGYLGDSNTRQLLTDLSRNHPRRRTRLAAYESLIRQTPFQAAEIWEQACRDPAPLVNRYAHQKLAETAE